MYLNIYRLHVFFFQFGKNCTTCLYFKYAAFCTVFNSQSCFALVPGDGSIIEGSGTSGGEGVFCACQILESLSFIAMMHLGGPQI